MINEPVTVNKIIIENTMNYKGTPVLHYKIEYPQFIQPYYQNVLDCINQWYHQMANEHQIYYETTSFKEAAEQYEYSAANQFPFHMHEAISVNEITYNQDGKISLFNDIYTFTGGAHGNTVRSSATWDITRGCLVTLSGNSYDPIKYQAEILNNIREQAALQMERGENWYFDDYPQLIIEHFNPESFYLTPNGKVIYYQQYDIAPYSSGIPEFLIQF